MNAPLRTGLMLTVGVALAIGLSGCGSTRRALGMEKTVPDEFAVVNRGPLVMPPDFNLKPPVPGADRPQEQPVAEQARSVLIGQAKLQNLRAQGLSRGEVALLAHAGADAAPADVRTALDRESSTFAPEDKQFTHKLLNWKDEGANEGVAVDPAAETKRLAENKAEGKKANEGKVPTIGKGGSSGRGFLGVF